MKEILSKRENTVGHSGTERAVFFFLLILSGFAAVYQSIGNYDELWNYTFGSCIARGMLPYRDFNMLQTPLAAMINGLLFTIFGRQMIVMRLAGAVLFACIGTVLYRIAVRLGASRWLAVLPGVAVILLFMGNIFFEYSGLMIFFEMCMIDLDSAAADRGGQLSSRYLVLSGLPAGLAVLSKQTFGVFICAGACLVAAGISRQQGGSALRAFLLRMTGCLIPCVALVVGLFAFGIWSDFWDMCFKGISSFTASYSYLEYLTDSPEAAFRGILLPLCLAGAWICAVRRHDRKMMILAIYTTFGMINLYPLANGYHIITTFAPALAAAAAILNRLILKISDGAAGALSATGQLCCLAAGVYLLAVHPVSLYLDGDVMLHGYRHLEGIFCSQEDRQEIDLIHSVIEDALDDGSDIIILDNQAQLYLMQYDIYHKNLDMFLLGNTGSSSPEDVLVQSLEPGTYYLVPGEGRSNTQYPAEAVQIFCQSLNYLGDIGDFRLFRAGEETP